MRTIFLVSLVLSAALGAHAQTVVLTARNIGEWSVVGADSEALVQEGELALPAGVQIDRTFGGPGIVILRAVSHPAFSSEAGEHAMMGVGPVSIAFARNKSSGQFRLVVGESSFIDLPWTTSIASNDQAVELTLGYDPSTGAGLVGWQGRWEAFDGSTSADPVEVWLSAGSGRAWPLDSVEVIVVSEDQLNLPDEATIAGSGKGISPGLRALLQQLRGSQRTTGVAVGRSEEHTDSARHDKGEASDFAPSQIIGLEIFTPPSVRQRGKSGEHARNIEKL